MRDIRDPQNSMNAVTSGSRVMLLCIADTSLSDMATSCLLTSSVLTVLPDEGLLGGGGVCEELPGTSPSENQSYFKLSCYCLCTYAQRFLFTGITNTQATYIQGFIMVKC